MAGWETSGAIAVRSNASDSCAQAAEPAERAVQEELESIPTLFGRLLRIAQLGRRLSSRDVRHFAPDYTVEEFDAILSRTHQQFFYKWLDKGFHFRVTDMTYHFTRLGKHAKPALTEISDPEAYSRLIPGDVGEPQRSHFMLDIGILLAMVRSEL